ncbi:MAG: phosphopyruvate hydratase [Methylobacteriaceae bacterium]|nr:phosphopyruvate hydratase [Methylobacteriaceae bacterium]
MKKTAIAAVKGRQVLDSRGRPTVEADVVLQGGAMGRASVPSGASTGHNEAHELRDGIKDEYFGRGVGRAVTNVDGEIAQAVRGLEAEDQRALDLRMREADGTPSLSRLGANAILAVSLAACRAAAEAKGEPLYRRIAEISGTQHMSLPVPMVNILSGGLHAGRGMDVQDFLAVPLSADGYPTALHMMMRVRTAAESVVARYGAPTLLADEGGLSPGCPNGDIALDLMVEAIEEAGLRPGREVGIALDIAATSLADDKGNYALAREGRTLSAAQMIERLAKWKQDYPLLSIEDGLHDEDWDNWTKLTTRLNDIQIVGDDLFCTNPARIETGVARGTANCVLIKLNQNGTLTGTLDAIRIARSAGYATVISARSGETADSFMSDLAVGTAGGQIKIGSLRNSERLTKYNQLLRIAEDTEISYAGARVLAGANRALAT